MLRVPVSASDGAAESQTFELQIDVIPVNVAPVITGQNPLVPQENSALTIWPQDVHIDDPDNGPADLAIAVQDGTGHQRASITITPNPSIVGTLQVSVVGSDGELEGESYMLMVTVNEAPKKKKSSGGGASAPLMLMFFSLSLLIRYLTIINRGGRGRHNSIGIPRPIYRHHMMRKTNPFFSTEKHPVTLFIRRAQLQFLIHARKLIVIEASTMVILSQSADRRPFTTEQEVRNAS